MVYNNDLFGKGTQKARLIPSNFSTTPPESCIIKISHRGYHAMP